MRFIQMILIEVGACLADAMSSRGEAMIASVFSTTISADRVLVCRLRCSFDIDGRLG